MDDGTASKVCTKCGNDKPRDEFYVKKTARDGRQSRCKACQRRIVSDWAQRNQARGRLAILPDDYAKTCTKCAAVKPAIQFYSRRVSFDGLTSDCAECIRARRRASARANRERETQYTREWREKNQERYVAYMADWRAANQERMRETARAWAKANAEHLAQLKRDWFEKNRDAVMAWRRENRDRVRAINRRSAEKNREVRTERQRQRRAAMTGANVEQVDLGALWTGTCALCTELLSADLRWPDPLSKSLDHIHPLSLGGAHEVGNLQWTHLVCNIAKGNRVATDLAN